MKEDKFLRRLREDSEIRRQAFRHIERVENALLSLEREGYVQFNEDRTGVALTDKGIEEAKRLKELKKRGKHG